MLIESPPRNVAISGTGYIARQLAYSLSRTPDLRLVSIFTRRPLAELQKHPFSGLLTNSIDQLVDQADLVVECSGDPINAANVVQSAFACGLSVVTMNTEFHVTCGSSFVGQGYLTEAEGDQPGCIAALHHEVREMGFLPLVLGNLKGFLDHHPTPETMRFWADRQGISLQQVTAFTDGTKLQMEQALVANGLGATIVRQGMSGLRSERKSGFAELGKIALATGQVIADYLIDRQNPPGVFILAESGGIDPQALSYLKMGDGPVYCFERLYHLCALEIPRTIHNVLNGAPPLLDNSRSPGISVAAIAKRDLPAGWPIERGLGGFDLRGEAIIAADSPDHLPIGIVIQGVTTRSIAAGQMLTWNDIDLPESLALDLTRQLFKH